MGHGARAGLPGGLLLPYAARYRFDRLLLGFQGGGTMGILIRPA